MAVQLEKVEEVFSPLVVISSCTVAFANGSHDEAYATGPLAAGADIGKSGNGQIQVAEPIRVLIMGGVGLASAVRVFG